MSANVESMFYVRETPWHGLGTKVMETPDSEGALIAAGLNWNVIQEPIFTGKNEPIRGYKANIRDSDRRVLGVVTDRYKVIQNHEAFAFTDELLGQGADDFFHRGGAVGGNGAAQLGGSAAVSGALGGAGASGAGVGRSALAAGHYGGGHSQGQESGKNLFDLHDVFFLSIHIDWFSFFENNLLISFIIK